MLNDEKKPTWASVIIVPKGDRLLAIARNFSPKDINFPGGNSEPFDLNPRFTAIRELEEETGLFVVPEDLIFIDRWRHHGKPVYAYFARTFKGRQRSSDEGRVFWTRDFDLFKKPSSTFAVPNQRLLEHLEDLSVVRSRW